MAGAEQLLEGACRGKLGASVRVVRAPCMGACDRAPVCAVGHVQVIQRDAGEVPRRWRRSRTRMPCGSRTISSLSQEAATRCSKPASTGKRTRDDMIKIGQRCRSARPRRRRLPTGRKWTLVRAEPAPRLLAVNADEGEPGTFKDRYYLGTDPHRFIEGMLIAAWVVEARETYIYIRDEYPEVRLMLLDEIAKVERAGLATHTEIHLRRGAGAYICGEESAMIEIDRGQARAAAPPPALRRAGRSVRPPDARAERRDAVLGPRHRREGRRVVHLARPPRAQGLPQLLGLGPGEKPGRQARAGRHHRARADRRILRRHGRTGHIFKGYLPGGASGGILPASMADEPLDFGTLEKARLLRRVARGCDPVRQGRHEGGGAQPDEVLRGRELRPVHALPGRHRESRQADGARGPWDEALLTELVGR